MDGRRGIQFLIAGVLVCGLLLAAGVFVHRQREAARRAAEAEELAREREEDRREAAVAFADPAPPTDEDAAAFRPVFDRLGATLRDHDAAAANELCDADGLVREIARTGAFDRFDRRQAADVRAELRLAGQNMGKALVDNPLARWDRTEVRRVRWSADRTEAVVIAVHWSDEGDEEVPFKMRWWLTAGQDGWKVYDFEDLALGFRASHLIGGVITPEFLAGGPAAVERLTTAVYAVRAAMVHMVKENDIDAAEEAIRPARGIDLPGPLAGLQHLAEGVILLNREDSAGALARFEAAERTAPDMPVAKACKSFALSALGRHEEGLAAARAFLRELGPDPYGHQAEGMALEGLGRADEAAAAFRKSLDELPDDADVLAALRRVLPAGKKGELGDRLARTRNPSAVYAKLIDEARAENDQEAVRALTAALAKLRPGDPSVVSDQIRQAVAAGKPDEAAAVLRARLDRPIAPDDRRQVVAAFVFAMQGAGKPVEGYRAVPPAAAADAFRALGDDLADDLNDEDADGPVGNDLRKLVAAHRERSPDDPWLRFYEAELHVAAKDYAAADRLLAEGAALLAKQKTDDEKEAEGDRGRFHSRRVFCLYKLGQGSKAYETLQPARDTFAQLAHLYLGDKDRAGLRELVGAHAAADREDESLRYWKAEVLFLGREFDRAAEGFEAYRQEAGPKARYGWVATDKWVRSLLRAGKARQARTAAREVGEDGLYLPLRAAVAAANGDAAGVDRLLADQHARGPFAVRWVYDDEDFARHAVGPAFEELRKKYPVPEPEVAPPPRPKTPAAVAGPRRLAS
jgi:tetratricopeptide (TPR) repeat protein